MGRVLGVQARFDGLRGLHQWMSGLWFGSKSNGWASRGDRRRDPVAPQAWEGAPRRRARRLSGRLPISRSAKGSCASSARKGGRWAAHGGPTMDPGGVALVGSVWAQSRTIARPQPTTSALATTSDPSEGEKVVGVRGFEPPTSATRTQRSTKLSHTPPLRAEESMSRPPPRQQYKPAEFCGGPNP